MKRGGDRGGGASGGLKIPGAGASTVHAGIWNFAISALLRARTEFAAFAHSILTKCARVQRAPDGLLWPMPLPYPEVHRSAKSRAKDFDEAKIGLNYVVLALNWLAVGERLVDVSSIRLGTKLTRDQWCAVRRLRPLLSSWNACGAVSASDMGRCAAKVESVEKELRKLEEAAQGFVVSHKGYFSQGKDTHAAEGYMGNPGEEVGVLGGGGIEHVAKDVEPDRLFFHGEPSFDPVPFLDWRNRKTYTRPLDFAAELDPDDPILPKVKLRCAASSRIQVLEKLDQVKRLHLVDAASCRRGFENGLFCIPKDLGRDRMILDARRANACEESEKRWIYSLGSLQQFQHVFLEPEEDARLYAEDLREFYHCFRIGAQRRIRNALAGRYRPEELQHLAAFREELLQCREVVACLDTLAMGDTNAVAYGQVSHLSILLRLPSLTLQDFVSLRLRPSRKDWIAGLMIDDFLVVQKVRRGAEDEKIRKLVDAVRQAYLSYGLPRHEGKAIEGEERGEFWGAEFDGRAGRIRPSLKKLVPLGSLTLQVVRLGYSTVGLLEVLTGSFIAAFQLRRRLMSCVEEVYAAQRGRSRDCIVRLSNQLKDELLVMVSLLPMAAIDMRLQASDLLVASDASMNCQAAVCTTIGGVRTKELQRHSLQKGLWNRLLSPEASYLKQAGILDEEQELPKDSYRMHPAWEEVVSCCRFKQFGRIRRTRRRQHINLSEVQASLDAEKLLGRLQPNSYYIHLQDSQVSLACLVKGRSSSANINRLLRRSVPDYLASNVRPYFGYVRTKLNPADDPTRSAAVREPARQHASWWQEIGEEKFDGFDRFLEELGCHPLQTAELPEECELWEDAELEDSSAREQRRLRGQEFSKRRSKKGCSSRTEDEVQRTQSTEAEKGQRLQTTEDGVRPQRPKVDAGDSQRLKMAEAEGTVRAEDAGAVPVEIERDSAVQETDRGTADENEREIFSVLNSFDPEQFAYNKEFKSLQEAIRSGPGLLDLFSGRRGFAKAFVRAGCPWAICFDIKDGEKQNLLETQLQSVLLRLLSLGSFVAMAAGPVCASFSTAITPPWRTREKPRGKDGLSAVQLAKLDVGHRQLKFILELVAVCSRQSILFWIENPDGSWFWRMDAELSWDETMLDPSVRDFRVDQCRLGTAWRKRTRFRTNSHAGGQKLLCRCTGKHLLLRGKDKLTKQNYTKLAESYPQRLCTLLATVFAIDAGFLPNKRPVSVSDVVSADHKRIGEAKNPGPRRSNWQRRELDIDDFQLLEPQTVALRSKLWTEFESWLSSEFPGLGVDDMLLAPAVFAKALEAYGRVRFSSGSPLHYYRQLLAHIQREYPVLKSNMGGPWQIVSRWEIAEPLQHRTPIPEPLALAVAALGFLWRWPRFSCVVLLTFYGILRVGEVLKCLRKDLLTPIDLLDMEDRIYLKVSQPKSRRRGPKVQYGTFDNKQLIPLLIETWQSLQPNEQLYPFSASVFRRRWDAALARLGVGLHHRITPGSLRGGGAVAAHKRGCSINDLLWKMRLQHQRTLGYYLQEMTAVSVLPLLTDDSRADIAVLQWLMPHLADAARGAQV